MRQQFPITLYSVMEQDESVVVLLGDVGSFLCRNISDKFPKRLYNLGICEQSIVGVAAGLSKAGFIPVFYGIAPFIVERAHEQLKIDFGYQNLIGNFVSVGASYDYAALGCTHHCPADVGLMKMIPNMDIVVPGTSEEFDFLFRNTYNNGLTYYRLSEHPNNQYLPLRSGYGRVVRIGELATIIAVGTMLDVVLDATVGLDVTVLYYTVVEPFDAETLRENMVGDTLILCEPYYEGALTYDIQKALDSPVRIKHIGVPRIFLNKYGTKPEHDEYIGLTKDIISTTIKEWL